MVVQVVVYGFGGDKMTVDVANDDKALQLMTVLQLKQKIASKLPGSPEHAVGNMQLVFATKRLDTDSTLLCAYGIQHKSIIQMVMTLDGGVAV